MTQQTEIPAHLSILFPNQTFQHPLDPSLVTGSNSLTASALCLCWSPANKDSYIHMCVTSCLNCTFSLPGCNGWKQTYHPLTNNALPRSHWQQVGEPSLQFWKEKDERRWMSLTNVSLLPSCLLHSSPIVSPWSSVQERYWKNTNANPSPPNST